MLNHRQIHNLILMPVVEQEKENFGLFNMITILLYQHFMNFIVLNTEVSALSKWVLSLLEGYTWRSF